jgi:LacI family transcriptional regulator
MNARNDITIYDLAKVLKISPATVSRALNNVPLVNEKTRDRIMKTARDLGYRQNMFASSLRSQRTYFVGAVVPDLNQGVTAGVVAGAQQALDQGGYHLVVTQSMNDAEVQNTHIDKLCTRRMDGLLIAALPAVPYTLVEADVPVVLVERSAVVQPVGPVTSYQAAYALTALLATRGCRRIVYFSHSIKSKSADAVKAYLQALSDHGLALEEDLLFVGHSTGIDLRTCRRILSIDPWVDGVVVADEVVTAFSIPGRLAHNAGERHDSQEPQCGDLPSIPGSITGQIVLHGKMAGFLLTALMGDS